MLGLVTARELISSFWKIAWAADTMREPPRDWKTAIRNNISKPLEGCNQIQYHAGYSKLTKNNGCRSCHIVGLDDVLGNNNIHVETKADPDSCKCLVANPGTRIRLGLQCHHKATGDACKNPAKEKKWVEESSRADRDSCHNLNQSCALLAKSLFLNSIALCRGNWETKQDSLSPRIKGIVRIPDSVALVPLTAWK